jgi:hypothetical protein
MGNWVPMESPKDSKKVTHHPSQEVMAGRDEVHSPEHWPHVSAANPFLIIKKTITTMGSSVKATSIS